MDTAELKRLAENTTPGPWRVQHPNAGERGWEVANASGLEQICADVTDHRAEFIAAANPAAVLELIAENERLREHVRVLSDALTKIDRMTEDAGFNIGGPIAHSSAAENPALATELMLDADRYLRDISKISHAALTAAKEAQTMFNGLTESETSASASVSGPRGEPA